METDTALTVTPELPPGRIVQHTTDAVIAPSTNDRLDLIKGIAHKIVYYEPSPGRSERLIEVYSEDGELLESCVADSWDDAVLGVIERLRPPNAE